jgi:exonuclease V gamma subunit
LVKPPAKWFKLEKALFGNAAHDKAYLIHMGSKHNSWSLGLTRFATGYAPQVIVVDCP